MKNNLTKEQRLEILNVLTETGGDFAEVFMEDTVTEVLEMYSGKISNTSVSKVSGAGVRIVKDNVEVNSSVSDYSYESLMKVAKELSKSFEGKRRINVSSFNETIVPKFVTVLKPCKGDNVEEINILNDITKGAMGYSEKIVQVRSMFWKKIQDMEVFASDGTNTGDHRNNMRVTCVAIAKDGENMQSNSRSYGRNMGMEMFDGFDGVSFGKEVAIQAVKMLDAVDMVGGDIPVVIDNGFGGVILHEACGHSLEATAVARGLSVFCGKLGQQIASPIVNAVDEGETKGEWGSINIDDEGSVSKCRKIIENGILKTYLVDKRNAKIMNHPATSNSRRQDYKFRTTSRMTNTYFLPGKDKFEDIIKSVKYGLYCKEMGGGSVNPGTGEFNFAVNVGYLIEDGKITKPVKGATLVGAGHEVLERITMISDNLQQASGMCGSMSGSIPVNVGQPTIKVSHIIVGGKGGK